MEINEGERIHSFQEQFASRKTLETPVGNAKFVDIVPQQEAKGLPLILIPGWGITLNTEKQLLEDLHNAGKHTISLEFPRFGGKVLEQENTPQEVLRQAEIISELIKSRPEEKMDVVAQSMGAMDLVAAVKLHPELLDRIGKVVLISPAGLTGNDNFFKLVARFAPHLGQHLETSAKFWRWKRAKNNLRTIKESGVYIVKNPLRAVKGEAVVIAGSDMYEGLKDFQDAGIKVGIMQGHSDKLTPAEKLWKRMTIGENKQTGEKQTSSVDIITMFQGGHSNIPYGESGFANKILVQLKLLS